MKNINHLSKLLAVALLFSLGGANAKAATMSLAVYPASLEHIITSELSTAQISGKAPPRIETTKEEAVVPSQCVNFTNNPFSAPTSSVDVITEDAFNLGAGSNHGCQAPQNEPALAVNPTNPNNVVISSNDYRLCCDQLGHNDGGGLVYTSFDGGKTFSQIITPGWTAVTGGRGIFAQVDSAGDPSLAFSPDGRLYFSNIAFSRIGSWSLVAVAESDDGGLTWSRPHVVAWADTPQVFLDKDWITYGGGQAYVSFTVFLSNHLGDYIMSPIVVASSHDTKQWKYSYASNAHHPYNQGSIPQFYNGHLYVAFESVSAVNLDVDSQVIAYATRRGEVNKELSYVWDDTNCFPSNDNRETLTGEAFRITSLPAFAIDPVTGHQTVVWADNPSCDAKNTQSAIEVVSGDGGHYVQETLPGIGDRSIPSVAARAGQVAIGYYTRAYATDGVSLDYALRLSSDGWSREWRLTEESSNPWGQFDGAFIGDYTAAAYGSDGVLHLAWTDFRGNPGVTLPNQDIYTSSVR